MANLTPWHTQQDEAAWPVNRFRSPIERLFDGFFQAPSDGAAAWLPPLDVIESEKDFVVRVELPGIDPKDVELTVKGNVLTLSGEKKARAEEKNSGYTRMECAYGAFQRDVTLPEGVDPDRVKAEGEHGVLEIRIPKPESAAAKRIQVSKK